MTRFHRAPLTAACLLLLAACSNRIENGTGSTASATTIPKRPNIVLVLLDDLDQLITPCWEAMPKTRLLLKERGLTFEQSFAPNPICCPARATLLTGLCSHNTGVLTNNGDHGGWGAFKHPLDRSGQPMLDGSGQPIDNEDRTLGVYLQEAGYRTTMIGKYLNGYDGSSVPRGWSEWHAFIPLGGVETYYTGYHYRMMHVLQGGASTVAYHGSSAADYSTDVVRETAVAFIKRQSSDPFFMFIAPTAPHGPLEAAPRHQALAQQWAGMLPKRPNYDEPDISDKSSWLKKSGPFYSAVITQQPQADMFILSSLFPEVEFPIRMGTLYAVDDLVAAVVAELVAAGKLDDTIIVFASDNGYNLGAHRLIQKGTPYEEALRVPLVVAGPGVRTGVSQAMIAHQDYAATFLELAGAPIPAHLNGRSFVKLLQQPDSAFPASALGRNLLIEFDATGQEIEAEWGAPLSDQDRSALRMLGYPPFRGLRTPTHAYIEWYADEPHEYELYDLTKDPYQLDNVLATPLGRIVHKPLVTKLQARLDALRTCVGQGCL